MCADADPSGQIHEPTRGPDSADSVREVAPVVPARAAGAGLDSRHVEEVLARFDDMRRAHQLRQTGLPELDIAEVMGTSEAGVRRMLGGMAGHVRDGHALAPSPEEIIYRAWVDRQPREDLITALCEMRYTFRQYAPDGMDGALSGTWDQVRRAHMSGLLSKEEFDQIASAVEQKWPGHR